MGLEIDLHTPVVAGISRLHAYVEGSGCVHAGKAVAGRDVVVFLSHSGGSEECRAAASHLVQRGVATLAITGNPGRDV